MCSSGSVSRTAVGFYDLALHVDSRHHRAVDANAFEKTIQSTMLMSNYVTCTVYIEINGHAGQCNVHQWLPSEYSWFRSLGGDGNCNV
jgi:hypothetical protein